MVFILPLSSINLSLLLSSAAFRLASATAASIQSIRIPSILQ